MNMLYEGLRENGATIIVPSTAVESMNLGAIGGLAALARQGAAAPNTVPAAAPAENAGPSP